MSSTAECVAKTGVVQSIENHKVIVKVMSMSACASCHAKGACTASDTSEKLIEVALEDAGEVQPGQLVTVNVESSAGNVALFYGYILPFLLVFVALIVSINFVSEVYAGLISLGILLPYYGALYMLRNKMGKRFRFTIS
ncbi:MAG: SoxR reducing system RseC family protein [Lentimicrobium sp.]|jgi:sigma-E factor negative regulatory protein RseC|nr:SoxR reducing system RseC family protein [Lentimicrobium sp.]